MLPLFILALALVSPLAPPPASSDRPTVLANEIPSDGRLADAVAKLKELGVVTDSEYWLANARQGKTCDGGMVADLIVESGIGRIPIVEPGTRRVVGILSRQDLLKTRSAARRAETDRNRYIRPHPISDPARRREDG